MCFKIECMTDAVTFYGRGYPKGLHIHSAIPATPEEWSAAGQAGALSYSAMNTLRSCGEQYRLDRIENHPRRPSVPAVAGQIVHAASEAYDLSVHGGGSTEAAFAFAAVEALSLIDGAEIDNGELYDPKQWISYGKQDWQWFKDKGIRDCLRNYHAWRTGDGAVYQAVMLDGEPAIETPFVLTFSDGFGEPTIVRGVIDRIWWAEFRCLVVDLKTGAKPKSSQQLATYRLATAIGAESGASLYGMYVYNLKNGPVECLTPRLDINGFRLYETFRGAKLMRNGEIFLANPGESCQHCGVSDSCDFVQSVC